MTCAESEKRFKSRENRRARRAVKAAIEHGEDPPHQKAYGNPWAGDKDGKRYRANRPEREMRK